MACQLHAPLFLLSTLIMALTLIPNTVLGSRMVAGIEESSMQEEGAQEALDYAVRKYNERSNDLYLSSVVDVQNVQKQVVAGEKYYFYVILGQTTCLKTQADLTNCPLNDQADQQERTSCYFEVSSVPWENQMSVTTSSCYKI